MKLFNPKGKTAMKTSLLISAIAACGLLAACTTPAPVVSAQEQFAPAKPPMSMEMDKHMSKMQENMKTMRGMGGPMMMGSGQSGGMMMGGKKEGMTDADMMKRHEMMEKRMDMMQMMMEQMMQHDQAMDSMPAK